jgi:plasmid stabilization system protein ParE
MNRTIVFRRVARFEFDEAADWYETRRARLGEDFTAAVQEVLDRVVEQPEFYAASLDDIREAPVKRFPYCIYYRTKPDTIVILAVFHTARDPGVWQSRS